MEAGTIVVAFARTLDAFAFEDAARERGVPGRLIPLPTGIAATCGLAWKLPVGEAVSALGPVGQCRRQGVYRYADGAYASLGS